MSPCTKIRGVFKHLQEGLCSSSGVTVGSRTGSGAELLPPTASSPHMHSLTYKKTRYQHPNIPREISILQALKSQNVLSEEILKCWQFHFAADTITLPVLRLPATHTTWRSDSGTYGLPWNCHVYQLFIERDYLWACLANPAGLCEGERGSELCRFSDGS